MASLQKIGDYFRNMNDIVKEVITSAQDFLSKDPDWKFSYLDQELKPADCVVESGIFNIKMDTSHSERTTHEIKPRERMDFSSQKGMAFNFLTKYSNPEYMRPDLYFPDPCFFFDYCKKNFSKNVALFHDYQFYDFTIIVRK